MKFTGERMIPDENRHDAIYAEHLNRYFFASHFVKNRTVLDIASGSGYGSEILQKAGARRVYGVDISEEAIEFGKELYKDCLLYTSPSPRDRTRSRMPSSA